MELRKAGLEPTEPAPKADMLPITPFSGFGNFEFPSESFLVFLFTHSH